MRIKKIKFLLFFNLTFFPTNSTNNNFGINDDIESDNESDSDNISNQSAIINEKLTIKEELLEHFFNNDIAIDLIYEYEEVFFDGKNLEELIDEVIEKLKKLEKFKKLEELKELEKSKKINNLDFKKFINLKLKEKSYEFIFLLINIKESPLVQREKLLDNLFLCIILLFNKSIMNENFYILTKEIFNFLLEYLKKNGTAIYNINYFHEYIDKSEIVDTLNSTITFYKNLVKFSENSLKYINLESNKVNIEILDKTFIYFKKNPEIIQSILNNSDIDIIIKNREELKKDIYLK